MLTKCMTEEMNENYTCTPLRSHLQTYTSGDKLSNCITPDSEENFINDPARSHLQSYTAGEEESRLSKVAKTFGLIGHRTPRKPVRLLQNLGKGSLLVAEQVNAFIQDTTFENAVVGFSERFGYEDEESHALISLTEEDEDDLSLFDDTIAIRKLSVDGSTSGSGYSGSLAPVIIGTIKGMFY